MKNLVAARTLIRLVCCGFLLTTGSTSSSAQTADGAAPTAPRAPRVDVTPFVSIGSEFSSQIGVSLAFGVAADTSVEIEAGYRRNEMAAFTGTVNLLYQLPRVRRATPYAAVGVGLEQYGTPLEVPRFGVITTKHVGPSVNVGGGIRVPISGRWDYRSDVRWLNFSGGSPEGWRLYNGISARLGGG